MGKFFLVCIYLDLVGFYYGFDVFFYSLVDIKKDVRYYMKGFIFGGVSFCFGENG